MITRLIKHPRSLLKTAFLLLISTSVVHAGLTVVSTTSQTGSVTLPGSLPGATIKTIAGVPVLAGDAVVFGYSNNKKITDVSGATVEITEAGNAVNVIATFDHINSFNGLPTGNDSGGLYWANNLPAGTYDVVISYQFEASASGNASTGSGIAVLRADSGAISLNSSLTGDISGTDSQDLSFAYTGLPGGGVFVEAIASNDSLTANAGGTNIYNAGTDKRTAWHAAGGLGGDITNTYTVDFGGTGDTASGGSAYFTEGGGATTTFIVAVGQDAEMLPFETTVGLEWATTTVGADSVTISSDDPSVTAPLATGLTDAGDATVDFATMPATVTLTLDVLDSGSSVIDSTTLVLSKWAFAPFVRDFESQIPNPGVPIIDPIDIDDLLAKNTGAEIVAVSGTGSTGVVGVRALDPDLVQSNQTRFQGLLTAADNDASAFVFRWVIKNDAGLNATMRLGNTTLNSRATRSSYLTLTNFIPLADGEFHVAEFVMNNTSETLLYDHGNETGVKIGPKKAHVFLDGDLVRKLSLSGIPGPAFVDSAGFVSFGGSMMDITIDEFSLTALTSAVTTPIVGADFTDLLLETPPGTGRFIFNFNYEAGASDVYRSANLQTWAFAPGGENFAGGAYFVEDYVNGGTPFYYIAVPAGATFPSP